MRGLVAIGIVLALGQGGDAHASGKLFEKLRHARTVSARVQAGENKILAFAAKIAPHKFAPILARGDTGKLGPNRITEERPFFETKGAVFGVEVGLTLSELHQLRAEEGLELVHVIAPDGSTNFETVLARKPIGKGQRIELQGPALNTSRTPGTSPVGFRLVGVGLTSDLIDPQSKEAVSYTLEAKLTDRTVYEAGRLVAPAAIAGLAHLAASEGAATVARVLAGSVPIVSTVLAVSSARWAWHVAHDPKKSKFEKSMAIAHATSDAVRIVLPLAGTIANAGLVVVSSAVAVAKVHKLRKQLREQGADGARAVAIAAVQPHHTRRVRRHARRLELPRSEELGGPSASLR